MLNCRQEGKQRPKVSVLVFFGIILFSSFIYSSPLEAKFVINPMVLEIGMPPGESMTNYYEITSDQDVKLGIKVIQMWPVVSTAEKNPYPVKEWLTIANEVVVAAGQTTPVAYSLRSKPTDQGEVVARLYVLPKNEKAFFAISTGMAPIIYLVFEGTEKLDAELKEFGWQYVPRTKTMQFFWRLKNKSNVHLRPRKEIFIRDPQTKAELKKIEIPMADILRIDEEVGDSKGIPVEEFEGLSLSNEYEVEIKIYYGELHKRPEIILSMTKNGRLKAD